MINPTVQQALDASGKLIEVAQHAVNHGECKIDFDLANDLITLISRYHSLERRIDSEQAKRLNNIANTIDLNYHLVQLSPQVAEDIRYVTGKSE